MSLNKTSSKVSNRGRLLRLQRRIFRSLEFEARRLLGPQPASIRRYEREFRRDFAQARPTLVEKPALIRAVRAADVTFVADYHAFEQAQRTALRVLRESVRPGENWMIGLELVSSRNQAELDAFQAGRISLKEFLQAIRYQEEWGFPWRNYAPLFHWARQHGVRMIALNRPPELRALLDLRSRASAGSSRESGERDLEKRDRWAAGVLTDLFVQDRPPKVLVLYGELHVGSQHLPAALAETSKRFLGESLSSVVIHQNHDPLYWKLARQGKEHRAEILYLKKNLYCVLSGTPWAKLQSLVSWAEGIPAEESDEIESDELEAGPESPADSQVDYLSLMQTYGETLSELLSLEPASWSGLNALTIEQADAAHDLARDELGPAELRLVRSHVMANRRFYLPARQLAYLASPSANFAAELAAIHLLRQSTGAREFLIRDGEGFFRQVLEAAFGYFGSLLVNPRRKCDLPQDHARALLRTRSRSAGQKLDLQARRLALGALKLGFDARRSLPRPLAKAAIPAELAARYAGHIVGKRLHVAFLAGRAPTEEVRKIFLSKIRCEERYFELLRLVAPTKAPKTKSESL